jgi:hypothetical protein
VAPREPIAQSKKSNCQAEIRAGVSSKKSGVFAIQSRLTSDYVSPRRRRRRRGGFGIRANITGN